MTYEAKDIGRLVLDLVADVDIRRVSKARVKKKFGTAVAGITDNYKANKIYISKGQQHAETIRCILHELSHYYSIKYENIPLEKQNEDSVEERAAKWQKILYGDDL